MKKFTTTTKLITQLCCSADDSYSEKQCEKEIIYTVLKYSNKKTIDQLESTSNSSECSSTGKSPTDILIETYTNCEKSLTSQNNTQPIPNGHGQYFDPYGLHSTHQTPQFMGPPHYGHSYYQMTPYNYGNQPVQQHGTIQMQQHGNQPVSVPQTTQALTSSRIQQPSPTPHAISALPPSGSAIGNIIATAMQPTSEWHLDPNTNSFTNL